MKRLFPFLMVLILSFPFKSHAGKPILTIDTGGHKAKIRDVIFTSDGKHIVSASDDKTIRVWDVLTGEIVRVIRGQIGAGNAGMIFAAALSPNQKLLAVGGWLEECNASVFGCGYIRLFNLQTGQIKALLKGHQNVIIDLAFSPDGNRLISGSGDQTAHIWDVHNNKTVNVLKGHTDDIYAVAFSPDGSLVLSGSYDKTIRLWDGRTGKFIRVLANFDKRIVGLKISPDSSKVLVGNNAFKGPFKCFVYTIPSGNKITSFTEHLNTVGATDISPDGKTAVTGGGEDEEIYLWDLTTGQVKQKMVGKGEEVCNVGFAKDGYSIAWGKKWSSASLFAHGPLNKSFQIKLDSRSFKLSMGSEIKSDSDYIRGIQSIGPWSIQTKSGEPHRTLEIRKNGRVIHQITRGPSTGGYHSSLTLTPDGQTVISGGAWGYIASYNLQTGKKVNQFVGHTGTIWGVAASPDSRFLISGSSDQTVRLWEINTGKLLLTIFQGTDKEWVAWTPEGFFDCSPGGVKYIGYHINRGEEKAADYIRVDQIYDQFYRPDLVVMKLEGGHDNEIYAELSKVNIDRILAGGVPPIIEFITPNTDGTIKERNITLKIKLTDKGGGIGKIVYRINGVTIGTEDGSRGIKIAEGKNIIDKSVIKEKLITLQPGHNRIIVTAYNERNEIESRPTSIDLILKDVISEKPSLYVLSVGINKYRDHALKLIYSVSDGNALANKMRDIGKDLFHRVHVETLFDREATLERIEKKFDKLSKEVNTNDVFVFYVAGHGLNLDGKYHFIPWELIYQNEDSVRKKSLTQERIQALLAKIPALKSVVLLDTCNSGAFARPSSRGLAEKTAMDKLMRATGRATIAASSESQVALEGYKGHGVFTYALLQALKGSADKTGNRNGEISVNEIAEYVSEEVPKLTFKKWGYEQFPMQNLYGRSFPIGLAK